MCSPTSFSTIAHFVGINPLLCISISQVVKIGDRLDAEFYMKGVGGGAADVSVVRKNVDASQKLAGKAYAALSKADGVLGSLDTVPMRLGDILEQVEVKEKVEPDKVYKQVGVRWWGDGSFIREENAGREIKAKSLYRVSPGWIIYNRLFAFRGSFAIVPPEQDGCYVSGEFPTFKAKSGIPNGDLLCRYIVHCLNSPQYLQLVDKQSTGSTKTSRNRFNESLFENLTVRIPNKPADLKNAVDLLDRAGEFRAQQKQLVDLAEQMRKSVFAMLPMD